MRFIVRAQRSFLFGLHQLFCRPTLFCFTFRFTIFISDFFYFLVLTLSMVYFMLEAQMRQFPLGKKIKGKLSHLVKIFCTAGKFMPFGPA